MMATLTRSMVFFGFGFGVFVGVGTGVGATDGEDVGVGDGVGAATAGVTPNRADVARASARTRNTLQ